MLDGFQHGAVVGLIRTVFLQTHRLQLILVTNHRLLVTKTEAKVCCTVLDCWQHLKKRKSKNLLNKTVENIVVLTFLVYQIK